MKHGYEDQGGAEKENKNDNRGDETEDRLTNCEKHTRLYRFFS